CIQVSNCLIRSCNCSSLWAESTTSAGLLFLPPSGQARVSGQARPLQSTYSSRMTCALDPPAPNEETPARLGQGLVGTGLAPVRSLLASGSCNRFHSLRSRRTLTVEA